LSSKERSATAATTRTATDAKALFTMQQRLWP
jgi:hypothetical protein